MRVSLAGAALLFLAMGSTTASAAEPSHEGLFLRLTAGLGGASVSEDTVPEVGLSGLSGFFSFDLGGTPTHGLAIHARLSSYSLVSPSVTLDGQDAGELTDASLSFGMLGVGVTYYLPSNLYLTGVLGLSQATLELDQQSHDSRTGFGMTADLGYEWPVGGDWGLGLAGRIEFHSVPDEGQRLKGTALGLLFSATYH